MGKMREKYTLHKDITEQLLKDNGFKNGTYRENLYKNLVVLTITIDLNDHWWTYQVCDADKGFTLYIPYYNRYNGVNSIVTDIDKKINKVFADMEKKNIFVKTKKEKMSEHKRKNK